jgi:transcriptional regulator with XRE-family HTH domain
MNTINERLKSVRISLGLTQVKFCEKILLSQGRLTNVESGKGTVTERTIYLVCSAYNVNEEWLRTGKGEMFVSPPAGQVDALLANLSMPEICAKLLYAFDSLAPDQQAAVLAYARRFIASVYQDDPAMVAAAIAEPKKSDAALALSQRLTEEMSSASPGASDVV